MSAREITDEAEKNLDRGYGVMMINYANPDMVGHTGNLKATIKAIESVDKCLSHIVLRAQKFGYTAVVTADHGNAEQLFDPESSDRHTAHTLNPVPFVLVSKKNHKINPNGILGNVAPTILNLMDISKPEEMDQESLIV
jgi:2,3-bisphosphoglycerate-independent phosphoglycerate mutase